MKEKPVICLIDEDENVKTGWSRALGNEARLIYFQDHLELFNQATRDSGLIQSFSCINCIITFVYIVNNLFW